MDVLCDIVRIPLSKGMDTVIDAEVYSTPLVYNFRDGRSILISVESCSWHVSKNRNEWYAVSMTKHGQLQLQRLLVSAPSNMLVDHIDQNTLNNLSSNLRLATHAKNAVNTKRERSGVCQYRGLCRDKLSQVPHWTARVSIRSLVGYEKYLYLGTFTSEETAARHYDAAARILYGEFATLNFPNDPPVELHPRAAAILSSHPQGAAK